MESFYLFASLSNLVNVQTSLNLLFGFIQAGLKLCLTNIDNVATLEQLTMHLFNENMTADFMKCKRSLASFLES